MRLQDLDIVYKAVKLIRDKFNINFTITNSSIEAQPAGEAVGIDGTVLCVGREPELRIELTVTDCHSFFTEDIDLEYSIDEKDLLDGSDVDKVIGGDMKNYAPKMRETLRLAFIIYNGIRYAIDGKQKQEYIDKGWHPRVVSIQKQGYKFKDK